MGSMPLSFDLGNYTTVNDRLLELFAKYPDARIQNSVPTVVQFDGREWWLVTTTIWRDPNDPLPVIASAAEPNPLCAGPGLLTPWAHRRRKQRRH